MPEPDPMRRSLLLVLLLVTAGLAGCLDGDGDDGATDGEPAGLRPGDLLKVRFVEAFENGTVFNSTAGRDLPRNTTLADLENDTHEEVWWMFWRDFSAYPDGEDVLTGTQLLDLDANGRIESAALTQSKVETMDRGQRLTDQEISLWRLPPGVEDLRTIPAPGLFEAMNDKEEGQRMRIGLPPEYAFGERDENKTATFQRVRRDRPRAITNLSVNVLQGKSNFTASTEEGDLIWYEVPWLGAELDARVTRIGSDSRVDVKLQVDPGQTVRFHGFWNATVMDVTNETYDLRHDPSVGQRFQARGRAGTVTSVNATHVEADFNDPRAGERMVYHVRIVEIERFSEERDLWSRSVDPVGEGEQIHDVAWLSPTMPTVATTRGVFFTPTARWGEAWFRLSPRLDGREVLALAVSPTRPEVVYASVAGEGVLRSSDHGQTWTDPGSGLDAAPVDVTASRVDDDILYALLPNGSIHRSTDGAASWSQTGSSPPGMHRIEAGPNSLDALWGAGSAGIRRSSDAGATWGNATFQQGASDVAILSDTAMYTASLNAVFRSVDGGANWSAPPDPNPNPSLGRLAVLAESPAWLLSARGTAVTMSQQSGAVWRVVPT